MAGASASRSSIFAVRRAGRSARLDPEVLLQQRGALLIEMQCRGALAAPCVTAHQRAPGLFVKRIEAERLLGVLNRIPESSIAFEKVDKTRENFSRTLTETFPVRINPLARAVGQDVAFVQTCRLVQGRANLPPGRDRRPPRRPPGPRPCAASPRHASVREPASMRASSLGHASRRWCSSRRRLVNAWVSLDSGQREPAIR